MVQGLKEEGALTETNTSSLTNRNIFSYFFHFRHQGFRKQQSKPHVTAPQNNGSHKKKALEVFSGEWHKGSKLSHLLYFNLACALWTDHNIVKIFTFCHSVWNLAEKPLKKIKYCHYNNQTYTQKIWQISTHLVKNDLYFGTCRCFEFWFCAVVSNTTHNNVLIQLKSQWHLPLKLKNGFITASKAAQRLNNTYTSILIAAAEGSSPNRDSFLSLNES